MMVTSDHDPILVTSEGPLNLRTCDHRIFFHAFFFSALLKLAKFHIICGAINNIFR